MSDPVATHSMEFPAKSSHTTHKTFTFEELRAVLDRMNFSRAESVTMIVMRMRERFGEEAVEVAKQAIYDIGYKAGQAMAANAKDKELGTFLDGFLGDEIEQLYWGWTLEQKSDQAIVGHVEHCPLPRKWKQMGLSDQQMIELCGIFDYVDKGITAGFNEALEIENSGVSTLSSAGYCRMAMRLGRKIP